MGRSSLKTVVCVDDCPEILEVFEGYLEDRFNVVTFTDPQEALLYLRYFQCAVVVLDIFMPEIDGLRFIKELEGVPSFTGKILMCTGGGESGPFVGGLALDVALGLGATGAIMKPFSRDDLLGKIQNLLIDPS